VIPVELEAEEPLIELIRVADVENAQDGTTELKVISMTPPDLRTKTCAAPRDRATNRSSAGSADYRDRGPSSILPSEVPERRR
jgi:hypothetical protein